MEHTGSDHIRLLSPICSLTKFPCKPAADWKALLWKLGENPPGDRAHEPN